MRILLDVDRWDRADEATQDLAIAEVARRIAPAIEWLRTERFTARKHKIRRETCPDCDGRGGEMPQSGSTEYPDCETCGNRHEIEHPYDSEPLSHRTAVFRHRTSGLELVLVPGRIEIVACLVGRTPHAGEIPAGLRMLTAAETRHACVRAGAFDLAWEDGTWTDHPFGVLGTGVAVPRLACGIPGLEAEQITAFHELVDELGPIDPYVPPGCLARTGYGTADPPRGASTLAFSRDGRWLASGSTREVRVWDASTGRQLSRLAVAMEREFDVDSIAFSPDNLRLVAASRDNVELFEIATGESLAKQGAGLPASRMETHYNQHRAVAWLADGRLLVAEATLEGRRVFLSLVDPETGETLRSSEWTFEDYLYGLDLATSFDGTRAAVSLLRDGMLAIWDVPHWEIVRQIAIDRVSAVAIGGDLVLANGRDKVWAYAISRDGQDPGLIGSTALSGIAASPDGTRVAWQPAGGVGVFNMRSRTWRSCAADTWVPFAFSPDGARVATRMSGHAFAAIWPSAG